MVLCSCTYYSLKAIFTKILFLIELKKICTLLKTFGHLARMNLSCAYVDFESGIVSYKNSYFCELSTFDNSIKPPICTVYILCTVIQAYFNMFHIFKHCCLCILEKRSRRCVHRY